MDKATLKVANAIVRIVGVFETNGSPAVPVLMYLFPDKALRYKKMFRSKYQ